MFPGASDASVAFVPSTQLQPATRRVLSAVLGLVVAHAQAAHVRLRPGRPFVFIARSKSRRFRGLESVRTTVGGTAFQSSISQLGASAASVEFVDFAELTFAAQVALVSSARLVAGMHGARFLLSTSQFRRRTPRGLRQI